jgi:hypothetical protein
MVEIRNMDFEVTKELTPRRESPTRNDKSDPSVAA